MKFITVRAGMAAGITTLMVSLEVCSGGVSGTPRDVALGEWRPLQRTTALADRGEVGLVPLGGTRASTVSALADYYRERLGVNVRVLDKFKLPPEATDLTRGQIVAETVITLLRSRFPQTKYVIGVVDVDMYSSEAGYRFAFSNRDWGDDWGAAIVSTARMDPTYFRRPKDPELLMARGDQEHLARLLPAGDEHRPQKRAVQPRDEPRGPRPHGTGVLAEPLPGFAQQSLRFVPANAGVGDRDASP